MSVTGVCLAFETQVINWAERDLRQITPPAAATPLSLDKLLGDLREKNPDAEPTALTLNSSPAASILVSRGPDEVVYVNPYTGEILGHGSQVRVWLKQIEGWHRWLGASLDYRATGRWLTGAADLIFLGLAVTGLFLWWPRRWNWTALRPSLWLVRGLRGRARDWNWHNTIGFWAAPALIVVTLTGAVMSYPWAGNLLYTLTGNPPPAASPANPGGRTGGPRRPPGGASGEKTPRPLASLDALLLRVNAQTPDWKTLTLRLPQNSAATMVAMVQPTENRLYSSRLTVDARTGEVVKWEPYAEQNLGAKLRVWARFLHTGEAGGALGQGVAALASVGGVILVVTGLAMAVRRLFKGKSLRPSPAPSPPAK